jgi:polyhydroxyalkanoate synthesis regulator phasin
MASRHTSTGSRSAGVRRRTGRSKPAAGDESLREQLTRLLEPVDAVVIPRERLQAALDDAVERGRMTRDDATDLLAEVVRRGEDVLAEVDRLLGGALGDARRRAAAPADRVLREVDRARRVAGLPASFPVLGYDDLTAAQVIARMRDLRDPELRKVRDHERRNANRKTVLAAIEQRLA